MLLLLHGFWRSKVVILVHIRIKKCWFFSEVEKVENFVFRLFLAICSVQVDENCREKYLQHEFLQNSFQNPRE